MSVDGLTGSTGAGSLCLTSNNEIVFNSGSDACLPSLRETKHDIEVLDIAGIETLSTLESVSFKYNMGDGRTRYGFIAEDVASVDKLLATYDAEGTISGIDDRSMIAVVVKAMQEMWTRLEANFARDDEQDEELEYLRERVSALEAELDVDSPDEPSSADEAAGGDDAAGAAQIEDSSAVDDGSASSSDATATSSDETSGGPTSASSSTDSTSDAAIDEDDDAADTIGMSPDDGPSNDDPEDAQNQDDDTTPGTTDETAPVEAGSGNSSGPAGGEATPDNDDQQPDPAEEADPDGATDNAGTDNATDEEIGDAAEQEDPAETGKSTNTSADAA